MIAWRHKVPDSSHPVDPHYVGAEEWACYQCRRTITDAGAKVSMAFPKQLREAVERPLFVDPDADGLQVEGS